MHDKDMREKHFFNYNDVFATFWNALIFKSSTPAIDPDYLEDAPTEYVDIPKRTPFNRMRDIMKYYRNDAGLNLALVGIENQTVEDPTMLGRVICYDGLAYQRLLAQTKNRGKIAPVFTAVVYFGYTKRWSGPRRLRDIVDVPTAWKKFFNDYSVPIIELAWLKPREIEYLSGDMKSLAICLRKFRLGELDDWPDDEFTHIVEVIDLLKEITGNSWFDDTKCEFATSGRSVKMCEMFDKYNANLISKGKKEGKIEGISIGKKEGISIGENLEKESIAKKLMAMGMSMDDIANATGLSLDRLRELHDPEGA